MDFWSTYGGEIKHSEINSLIKNNASLETLFEQPTFLDEFYSQQAYLIEYLSRPEVVRQLVSYITEVDDFNGKSYTTACHFPFYAFTIFSNCNVKVTEVLFGSEELLSQLMQVGSKDHDQYITSQGYLFGMIKNWLAPTNPLLETFVRILKNNSERYVLPLVQNFFRSNSEIIKEILSSNVENFQAYQSSVFDYLIYFYLNEKFNRALVTANPEIFQNLFAVFKYLTDESIKFEYKKNYISKLFLVKNIKYREFAYELVYFRLVILNYLAKTMQVQSCAIDFGFMNLYKSFSLRSQQITFLVVASNLLRLLSANKEFEGCFSIETLEYLFDVLKFAPSNDILHFNVATILQNMSGWINSSPQNLAIVCSFVVGSNNFAAAQSSSNNNKYKNPAYLSTHFLSKILDRLAIERLGDEKQRNQMNQLKSAYFKNFKKLCFDGVNESVISLKKPTIKFDIDNEFELFGSQQAKDSHDGIRNSFEPTKAYRGSVKPELFETFSMFDNNKLGNSLLAKSDSFANANVFAKANNGGDKSPNDRVSSVSLNTKGNLFKSVNNAPTQMNFDPFAQFNK
jgi:hypothetical protein